VPRLLAERLEHMRPLSRSTPETVPGHPGHRTHDKADRRPDNRCVHHLGGRRVSTRALRALAIAGAIVVIAEILATPFAGRGLSGRPGVTGGYVPVGDLVVDACIVAISLFLTLVRPRNPIGWLLLAFAALGGSQNFLEAYGVRAQAVAHSGLPFGRLALSLGTSLWVPAFVVPSVLLLNLYPDGQSSAPFWRRLSWIAVLASAAEVVALGTSHSVATADYTGAHQVVELPATAGIVIGVVAGLILFGCFVLSVAGAVRRTAWSVPPERQQLLLLLTAAALVVPLGLIGPVARDIGLVLVPLAVTAGVLRYRLLGIEVVIRRTLLYGLLTGLVVAVYAVATTAVSAFVSSGPAPSLVAAALVAVLLVPLRDRLQALVDRVVYGARRDPLGAVRQIGASVSFANNDPLATVVASVAAALRARYVAIIDSNGDVAAAVGTAASEGAFVHPLAVGGEQLGRLVVGPAAGESALSPADLRLVETLAVPVAVVAHSVRLTEQLAAIHQRALTATHEERARIRRDLHDGLGPSLSGVALGLEAVESALPDDTATAAELTSRIRIEVGVAVEEVRRIIEALRPAALDDLGLVAALRERAASVTARSGLTVTVDATDPMPPLSPHVEAAVFRIADEALSNVVRHARATRCDVEVRVGADIRVSVTDNGIGLPESPRPDGLGLASMRQRATDLGGTVEIGPGSGGGNVVVAHLPLLQPSASAPAMVP
jgi:signal transduction histidine kinase